LHRKVNVAGAAALSLVSHIVLLSSWWTGIHAPVVRLTSQALAPTHSAVKVEHTVVRIAQLPPPSQHTVIDDPPADPDLDPVVSLTPEPMPAEPIPDLVWFDTFEDDMAAFTIRARRPQPEAVAETPPPAFAAAATTAPRAPAAAQDPPPRPAASAEAPVEAPADTTASPSSAEVVEPRPASDNRPPRYPGAARRRGWEGRVVLHVRVDATGTPLSVEITQSSGRDLLDQAAVEAVQGWTFEPARDKGRPVPGETDVSVRFELGT